MEATQQPSVVNNKVYRYYMNKEQGTSTQPSFMQPLYFSVNYWWLLMTVLFEGW